MKSKLFCLFLCVVLCMGVLLCGCSGTEDTPKKEGADSTSAPSSGSEETQEPPTDDTTKEDDTTSPETDPPVTSGEETEAPETEAPETKAPETKAPETKAPETKAPETKAPETKAPETRAPETKAPETKAPETKAPETKAPETKAPETKAPETKAPETKAPETEPEPEEPFVYDHVVIIGVDGGGNFFRNTDTPNIDRIFKNGAMTYYTHTSEPTISAQCWGSLLLGVTPEIHRLTNSIVDSTPYDVNSKFPSIFRVVRENDPDCELAAFCNWNPIYRGIIENNLGVTTGTGSDETVTQTILEYLTDHDPKLMFVQFDSVDGAGHSSGYGGTQHLKQITHVDSLIGMIYDGYETRGFLDSTLFIVTADHGGLGTSHGGLSDTEKYVMYAAAGKTVSHTTIEDMEIRDNTSIVLHAFGLDDKQPETWTSRIPTGIFTGVTAGERPETKIEYFVEHRTHESEPTPGNTLLDVIGADRVHAYLPLDGDVSDPVGIFEPQIGGKLYFVDGYYGNAARFDDGYVSLPDYAVGTENFSVAFWMKADLASSDPCLVSNKDWNNGSLPGFVLSLRTNDIKFNVGNGSRRMDFENPLPIDSTGGWMYVVMVVDRTEGMVRLSYDFGKFVESVIPSGLLQDSFDSYPCLNFGQDGSGAYGSKLGAVLDEIVVVGDVLTQEDVTALAAHYGAEP